ncbi:hypothetical protein KEM48_010264 [Puccinia striiformis f. sp. tritici PST-130]|nr:hypothetical protein KEM48_010264 [Puccinia striiformis f. sp. tritici PST-130]
MCSSGSFFQFTGQAKCDYHDNTVLTNTSNTSVFLVQAGLLDSSNSTESSLQNTNGSDSHLKISSCSTTMLQASSVACCEFLINLAQDLSTTNKPLVYIKQDRLICYLYNLALVQLEEGKSIINKNLKINQ